MSKSRLKDPQQLGDLVRDSRLPKGSKLALALDLGTTTGYSFTWLREKQPFDIYKDPVHIGQLDLSAGQYDSGAIRFLKLRAFLSEAKPDLVLAEDVKFTPSNELRGAPVNVVLARAAVSMEFFGALKGTLAAWCEENGVPLTLVPIGTIKKRATGKGNASKVQVIQALNTLYETQVLDPENYEATGVDNCADAFWAMVFGLEEYQKGL